MYPCRSYQVVKSTVLWHGRSWVRAPAPLMLVNTLTAVSMWVKRLGYHQEISKYHTSGESEENCPGKKVCMLEVHPGFETQEI